MILQKRQLMYLLFLVVASFLLVAPLSLSAQDIEEVSEELAGKLKSLKVFAGIGGYTVKVFIEN